MEDRHHNQNGALVPELYFLISKFLTAGPLQETAKVLVRELEDKRVLPRRTDWLGNEHEQTFEELERKYAHISPNHLLEICGRIAPIIDSELPPSVPGIISLLGSGRQSLLRTKDTVFKPRTLLDYCTRLHGVSLPDSAVTKPIHNIQRVLFGREYGGPVRRKLLVPTSLYSKTKLLRRTVGHLSSVYCVLFDRTGRYIITGADDLLVKIWSASDGRLLATLRGASAEITDIAINLDNTMLAAGSLDRILRVWDMQTTSPIAVLSSHTGMITSVNFCPSPRSDLKYLVTTSTDGSIAFWQYSTPRGQKITFAPKPTQFHEKLRPGQAQMMCTTFSPGGMFLAAGSADHHVRVYLMGDDGPKRILETEAYTDAVDSVQWSHRGLRFISGSKDGTAHIWTFESQQWKSVKLSMTERLPSCPEPEEGKKLKVTMIAWDASDNYVITAVNDFTIKIWNSKTAKLHRVLRGHKDELYVLESNPKDEHVLLSAGHDGQVFLWDIEQGISLVSFLNDINEHGYGSVFDAKWSPDGTMIAATDSHGDILIFGLGIGAEKYKILPQELFFHTDFRPLLRDAQHHVVDEQTQIMPHLMPPPFLVDADGNPHHSRFQRYVPGRENCSTDQLVPNLSFAPEGVVIEDNANAANIAQNAAALHYSQIDRMIAALVNRQNGFRAIDGNRPDQAPDSNNQELRMGGVGNVLGSGLPTSGDASSYATRRPMDDSGNTTPRQGTSWGRPAAEQQQLPSPMMPMKYVRRIYVRPMRYTQLQNLKQTIYLSGQFEMQEYKREMRRRPIMINTASAASALQAGAGRSRNTRPNGTARVGRRRAAPNEQAQPAYRTRAVRDQEAAEAPAPVHEVEEEEDEESSNSSGDSSYSNVEEHLDESSDDSDTESSDYSDWVADTPGPNLEPPKRSKRKPLSRRRTFSDDSSDDDDAATERQSTTGATAAAGPPSTGKPGGRRNKRVVIPPTAQNGEIPELYRPAEWLSEVIPRKAPYYPQMGDEVVYFRQGHQSYLDAVRQKNVYKLTNSAEPWKNRQLRDHELVRVIGIKYEIRPPRLCCLKLAMIDEDGNMTGTSFKIKYHDMPDVLDFLVLRQTFDLAVQRNWTVADRFRCMIGDGWWMGQIESRRALSPDFPDSYFMCFRVRWDNGEYEFMSPWDMEPIDEDRLPDEVGGAVPVLAEEIRATLYQPKSEEWHRGDRDGSCRRIIAGLEHVMRIAIAEHFLAPVDLNIYPDYAYMIEYPIDLTTVKSRFENHFYRRITSAQFDVRYLATNAEKYNRRHTNIVKHARIITDLCLRIIREPNDIDVAAVYHQLMDVYHSSESENDNESDVQPSTSTGPSTSAAAAAAAAARQRVANNRRSSRIRSEGDWRSDCRQLLDLMWQRPDSLPFREPVDIIEYPDYLEIIATPMDLRTVKEDLLGGNYDDPLDFAKDVRLIFSNSKNYNTNKRSREHVAIYSMTLRLSALFELHIKSVIKNWHASVRRANKNKSTSGGSRRGSSSPAKRTPPERNRNSGGGGGNGGTSTRRKPKATAAYRQMQSSDDDDEEDDDDDDEQHNDDDDDRPSGSQRIRRRNGGLGSSAIASTSGLNRVTSSSTTAAHRRTNGISAGTSGSSQQQQQQEESSNESTSSLDSEEDETSEEATTDPSSGDVDVDDNSNDSSPEQPKRRPGRKKKCVASVESQDSEESYNPINERRQRRTGAKNKRRRKQASNKRGNSGKRRRIDHGNEDDDDDYSSSHKKSGRAQADTNVRNSRRPRRGIASSEDASASPPDESTQDTISNHTPRKKGRPPKVKQPTPLANANEPSTSAAAGVTPAARLQLQSPSRNKRTGSARKAQNAAENDHSYHLPVRNGRIVESDTDSPGVSGRPTRQSVKRAILEWAHGSDIEEEPEEDSEEAEEILPTPTKDDDLPSTSRAALSANAVAAAGSGVIRQLRTNRNTVVEIHHDTDDDEDDSDNEPLSNNQQKAIPAGLKTSTPHPLALRRRAASPTTTRPPMHMTRSHATSSTTFNVATSSSNHTGSLPPGATHDHNYMGNMPSTSAAATTRTPRRILSRHQQNADELDSSLDPLENSRLLAAVRNLRRPTSTTTTMTTTTTTTTESTRPRRSGRPTSSQDHSSQQEGDDEDENQDDDDAAASDEGTDGGSSTQESSEEEEQDDVDSSDSEDNQPLTSYVAPSNGGGGRMRNNQTKKSAQKKSTGRRQRLRRARSETSFDVYDQNDDDYELEPRPSSRRKQQQRAAGAKNTNARNQRGGTRNQKRPRYNEQSEEDEQNHHDIKRRRDAYPSTSSAAAAASSQSQQHHHHRRANNDDCEDDDDDIVASSGDSDEQLVSVSSRGRVRKISAKARGIFKD